MNEKDSLLVFRNHPVIILRGMIRPIVIIAVIAMNSLDSIVKYSGDIYELVQNERSHAWIVVAAVFLLCLVVGLYQTFIWKNTFVTIDNKEIVWQKKGLFIRKKRQATLSNISNINSRASLIERIFGINRISLDLNSSVTADKADYTIWLAGEKAYEFKKVLNKRIRLYNEDSDAVEDDFVNDKDADVKNDVSMLREFSFKESMRHLFFHESSIFILGIALAMSAIGFRKSIPGMSLQAMLLYSVVLIIGFVMGIISILNATLDFKVARRGENLYVSSGFTARSSYAIPIRNIVAISVKQSVLDRLFGCRMLTVQAVGIKADKSASKNYISLVMNKKEFYEHANALLPEIQIAKNFQSMPVKTLVYYLIRNILAAGIIAAVAVYFEWWFVGVGAVLLFSVVAVLRYCSQKISFTGEAITVRKGLLGITEKTVQLSKIENVKLETNFITNLMGLTKLSVGLRGSATERKLTSGWFDPAIFNDIIRYYQNGER